MRAKSIKHIIVFSFIGFIMTVGSTGCFKGDVSVDVKANGSGVVSISFGMTQQAKALVASQGTNPFQDMETSLAEGSSAPQDVKVTTWIDGDYEWAKAEKEFNNLDEITKILKNKELFNDFSLTRKRGLFQDEFILDAEFDSLNSGLSSGGGYDIDPSAFIQMSFSARLPGKLVETNGLTDINDPGRIVWNMQSNQTVSIRARSTTWNWFNIVAIGGFLFLVGVIAIGGLAYFFYIPSQKSKQLERGQRAVSLPVQKAGYIASLDIENLLSQINTKALNSIGQIYKKQGEIALAWKNQQGQQKFIDVKELGDNRISINGQAYSATTENAKSGLVSALQKQKE